MYELKNSAGLTRFTSNSRRIQICDENLRFTHTKAHNSQSTLSQRHQKKVGACAVLNLLAHAFRCLVTVAHTVWKLIAACQLCPGPPSYRIWVYTISLKHLAGFKPVFLFSGELHLPVVYTCCYTSLPLIEVIMPVLRATTPYCAIGHHSA